MRVCGLSFGFLSAKAGWGVGRVRLCARSACALALQAGVCSVAVCASVRVSAAPRHSWLGVLGCACLCACSARTPPFPAGVCDVGVCLGSGSGCAQSFSPRVLGCVCWCALHACDLPILGGVCDVWVGCCLTPSPMP